MASRKVVHLDEKWVTDLTIMSGMRKKESSVKRIMMHILEFYEETFPEHIA